MFKWFEEQGLQVCVVSGLNVSFKNFEEIVKQIVRRTKKPILAVFPEIVFGETAIERPKVKQKLQQIYPILKEHGNAWLFFSVVEKIGKRVSNTGYIVGPKNYSVGKKNIINWKAYPKLFVAKPVKSFSNGKKIISAVLVRGDGRILRINSEKPWDENAVWWYKRSQKYGNKKQGYFFPQIEVGGKTIQLRVCADFVLKPKQEPDITIVPALELPEHMIKKGLKNFQKKSNNSGKKYTIIVHDSAESLPRVIFVEPKKNFFGKALNFLRRK